MINSLDTDDGLWFAGADCPSGVISCPFAKRSFIPRLLAGRRNLAFDGNLSVCRYRQSGDRTFDDIQRPAAQPADKIQLGPAPGNFGARRHKRERILPEGGHDGAAFSFFPVSRTDGLPMLSRAHPEPQQVSLVELHPVGSHVDVAALRVLVDHDAAGPDVTSTVRGMTSERGKFA